MSDSVLDPTSSSDGRLVPHQAPMDGGGPTATDLTGGVPQKPHRVVPFRPPAHDDGEQRRSSRPKLAGITVVVPARNEEHSLPHSLNALERALVEASHLAPHLRLRACIVLDSCTDTSESVVRAFAQAAEHRRLFVVEPLVVTAGGVGRARATGVAHAFDEAAADGIGTAALWIACTDADTAVPAHWLTAQMAAADTGVDVYVGTVEPDAGLTGARREEWMQRHQLAEGHSHVHGANLGIRASAYERVGGFASLSAHEDVDLVSRLRADATLTVRAADDARVVTSSRLEGRAVGGFATYLANLTGGVA